MDKKQLALDYMGLIILMGEKNQAIRSALKALHRDNDFCTVMIPECKTFIDQFMKETLGADLFDWIEFWMYDSYLEHGKRTTRVADDFGEAILESFDELWAFANGASTKEIIYDKKS